MFLSDYSINKIWIIILGIAASLFLVIGVAMITVDAEYLNGGQYLATAILCGYSLYWLKKWKLNVTDLPKERKAMFSLGLLLIAIGIGFNVGFWAFGFILLLAGVIGKEKKGTLGRLKNIFRRKK